MKLVELGLKSAADLVAWRMGDGDHFATSGATHMSWCIQPSRHFIVVSGRHTR